MYPIKSDLSVEGSEIISENLTVNGTSNFTVINGSELIISGNTTLVDIDAQTLNVSSEVTTVDLTVTGNTTLVDVDAQTLTVSGSSSLNTLDVSGAASFSSDITATNIIASGTIDSTTITTVDATVDGNLTVNGNTVLGDDVLDTVTIFGTTTVKENITLEKDLEMVGVDATATFQNVVINGSLSGVAITGDATLDSLVVTGNSHLNTVNIDGPVVLNSNVTGLNSSFIMHTATMQGDDGIIQFQYNDPARPTDLKSSIQPYSVTSSSLRANTSQIDYATIGNQTYSEFGLTAVGKSKIEYLSVTGNALTGDAQLYLDVAGNSNFAKTLTVKDIVVTGTTTGINADVAGADIRPNSVDTTTFVKGATLESTDTLTVGTNATIGGDLAVTSSALFSGDVVVDGQTVTVKDLIVTGTTTGVTAEANVDGLNISPQSVTSTTFVNADTMSTTNQMDVGGNLIVQGDTTVSNITVTGTVLNTLNANGIAAANVSVAETATIRDLIVTGTTSGVTAEANVDGLDINPNSVVVDTTLAVTGASTFTGAVGAGSITASSITGGTVTGSTSVTSPDLVATTKVDTPMISHLGGVHVGSDLVAEQNLTVNGTLTAAGGIDLSGTDLAIATLSTSGNATIGGDLVVSGEFDLSTTDVVVQSLTGPITSSTATITTANITDLTTTGAVTLPTATITSATIDTASVSGVTTLNGNVTSTNTAINVVGTNVIVDQDLTINGTLTAAGGIDLSGTDLSIATLTTSGNATIGGDLVVSGNFDITNSDLGVNSLSTVADVTVGGALVLAGTVTGNAQFGGNVAVAGTLGATGHTTLSTLRTTGLSQMAAIEGSSITLTGSLGADGNITGENVTANGTATAHTLNVTTGTSALQNTTATAVQIAGATLDANYKLNVLGDTLMTGDLVVTGVINSAIDLTARDISPRDINASGNITAAGSITAGTSVTAANAVIGEAGSTNNNLQINGNTVCTGNFEVQGLIIGALDQSTSDVVFNSVTTTEGVTVGTDLVLTTGTITGSPVISGDTTISGTLTVNGTTATLKAVTADSVTTTAEVTVGGVLSVTGDTTLNVANINTLNVAGDTVLTGTTTCTGVVTVQDLVVEGSLTTSTIQLNTDVFKTKLYFVEAHAQETVSTATWAPDGTSNVYHVTLTANTQILPIADVQGAGSWFIYLVQDGVGNHTVSWDSNYVNVGAGEVNLAAGSVTICQVVYCGYGGVYDLFIAQRPL